MVDWFNAIRAARFHYLQVAFPGASIADVSAHTYTHTHTHTHTHSLSVTKSLLFVCLAVAKANKKLHQGRLHGEDRSQGEALLPLFFVFLQRLC